MIETQRRWFHGKDLAREYSARLLVERMQDHGGSEGTTLAPPMQAGTRIVPPRGFRIVRQEEQRRATRFILSWEIPNEMLLFRPQYRILAFYQQTVIPYVGQNLVNVSWDGPFDVVGQTRTPPIEVVIRSETPRIVVFAVETRLTSGLTMSEDGGLPTCAAQTDPYDHQVSGPFAAAYQILPTDDLVLMDTNAANRTATLPFQRDVPKGKIYWVKKDDASANTMTLAAQSGELVDGVASVATTATTGYVYSVMNTRDGTWKILSRG